MAPGGGGKRKRGDRTYSGDGRDDGARPSPHRPGNLTLGHQNHQQQGSQSQNYGRDQYDQRGGNRRRASRGGRGGSQHSPINSPNTTHTQARPSYSTPTAASPSLPTPSNPIKELKNDALTQPSTTTAAPTQTLEQKPVETNFYYYEYITEERMARWKDSGRRDVTEDGARAHSAEDGFTLGIIYQELIQACSSGRLAAIEAGNMIKEILVRPQTSPDAMVGEEIFSASSLFLDNLSIVTEGVTATPSLKAMLVATEIPPQQMRRELESTLLEGLGMIRNTFVRMGIRQQTNLLYRQSSYNLLREETEGYSKLLTEIFTTSGEEPSTSEVVEETFERVKGMIGTFDLDVGRVLDITLDVFAAVLVKQYRFLVKYFRASSWWPQEKTLTKDLAEDPLSPLPKWALPGSSGKNLDDTEKDKVAALRVERDRAFWGRCKEIGLAAFFELGGRRASESALAAAIENHSGNASQDDEDHRWIEITKTLPPVGNKVAAQILGFKLRFYSSTARDSADILPVNLIYLAALLIKVGFISLRDLYPHLWPADQNMEDVREEKMKEKVEREKLNRPGGGAMNALLSAAPLPDDTIEGKTRESARLREADAVRRHPNRADQAADKSTPAPQLEDKVEELPEPSEQKIQLLKSLLCIGALPEALYMLGRFSWLLDAFPELPEYLHRILHHSLSKVYEPLRPLPLHPGLRTPQKIPNSDQVGALKGQIKLMDGPARKNMRWAQLDKEDTNEAIDYKFYWDDWADNVPICQTVDDVFVLCSTLMNLTGVKIGLDPTLLLKLTRIGSHSLATDSSESNMSRWIDLSKRLLVPSLSLTKCNPGVVNEVFELIKEFSTSTRYSIYSEWYSGQTSRLPDMKSAFDQAKAETKDVLKRISKTTLKPMARALAKVAYANPGIVFAVAIAQLESYENIVDAVVECARYFTYLAYDVLTWSLMSALGGTGRNRVQADGMLTSKWLAALSLFAGKVFKRYSVLNPTPVVQYVADQLRRGNSTDLIILEELTKSMAGIISDTNYNESQVLAMAGGEVLQAQTLLQLLDRRHESKSTAKRLMRSLTDSKLAGQLVVSLAQERQTGIFRIEEQNAHPKLLGNLFDQIHRILVQYLDLLRSNLSVKDFDAFVPDVAHLIADFGIDPSIAFWISRPSINAAVLDYDAKNGKRNPDAGKSPVEDAAEEAKPPENETARPTSIDGEDAKVLSAGDDVEMPLATSDDKVLNTEDSSTDAKDIKDPPEVSGLSTVNENRQEKWHPILQEVMDAISPALPKETYEILGLPFYVTFWHLSLSHLQAPLGSYSEEVDRQKRKIQLIISDRSDISIAGTKRKDKEKEAINEVQDRLRAECSIRVNFYRDVRARNLREKNHWFAGCWGKWDALNVALIEHCLFPRMVMSPMDALYTFKMFSFLHSNGATNFRTMGVLDQFFREKRLTSMMFLCSAKEAENLGLFLNEVLRLLSRWHADKALFEKEAFGTKKELPGFTLKMSSDKSQFTYLAYEDFRRILLKWHRNLSFAIKTCIGSGEYMHIRNAVNILNNINQFFPAVNWMGQSLLNSISDLGKSESREDLKVAAMSLIGALKKREKDWVLPQAFNLAPTENGTANNHRPRSTSAKPFTPRPDDDTSKALNPKAPDFQPSPRPAAANGLPKMDGTADRLEAEDGEIEDAKMTDAPNIDGTASNSAQSPKHTSLNVPKPEAEAAQTVSAASETAKTREKQSPSANPVADNISSIPPKPDFRPTPPIHSIPPARPDMSRTASSGSTNGRAPHNLPSKPDPPQVRPGDHRLPPRNSERNPHDHVRDSRYPESRDMLRDRGFERTVSTNTYAHGNERSQGMERDRMDPRWNNERPPPSRAAIEDRHGPAHGRDTRHSTREDRSERNPGENKYPEQHQNRRDVETGQPPRDTGMPPPRSNVPQHPINPDRAAMIQGSQPSDRGQSDGMHADRRPDSSRHNNQSRPDRAPRGSSPLRSDDRHPPRFDGRHEDPPSVHGRRPLDDTARANPPRLEDSHAPTGPRTGRPAGTAAGPVNPNDRFRESMKPSPIAPPSDPNHGRLSNEASFANRQAESQYGRLNSDNDIPSGPRVPNGNHAATGRGGRNASAPQPQLNTQLPPQTPGPPTPSYDRQAPSGPSVRGSPRKPPPFSPHPATSSAPPTPVAQSPDTAGIHPDRLKALQGSGVVNAENSAGSRGVVTQGPPTASIPPRGPNSNQLPSPAGPSTNNRGPPTGPAMANDRSGRDKRTFAGIQNVLQQASGPTIPERSGQGASIRGRGGRANNVNGPSPGTSAPPTPSLSQDQLPPREDLFAGRPNGAVPPQQSEDDSFYGRGARRTGPKDGPRDGDRRGGGYRSHSVGKDRPAGFPARPREDEISQGREGPRDRPRGFEGPSDRDMRGSGPLEANIRGTGAPLERELRDRGPPRDMRRNGRDDGHFHDRRGEPDFRDGPHRRDDGDRRDGGGGGRKRGRGGDEGQGERIFSESKRPRR